MARATFTKEEYERAAQNDIDKKTLHCRVEELYWEKERAITQPKRPYTKRPSKWAYVLEDSDISLSALVHRIKNLGFTPEEAARTPTLNMAERGYLGGTRQKLQPEKRGESKNENRL